MRIPRIDKILLLRLKTPYSIIMLLLYIFFFAPRFYRPFHPRLFHSWIELFLMYFCTQYSVSQRCCMCFCICSVIFSLSLAVALILIECGHVMSVHLRWIKKCFYENWTEPSSIAHIVPVVQKWIEPINTPCSWSDNNNNIIKLLFLHFFFASSSNNLDGSRDHITNKTNK